MTRSSDAPIIGVLCAEDHATMCADVVERSGGEPWTVPLDGGLSAGDAAARIGGLLVCGGDRAQPDAGVQQGQKRLLLAALAADMPVLCTGRGMHALNDAQGGEPGRAIVGHSSAMEDGQELSSLHRIFISPGSKLAAAVGSGGFVRVNSRHNEGVGEAQKSDLLMASAYSLEDGIIEALESPDHTWVLGVQFQPERRGEIPPHFDGLFRTLVQMAGERTSRREPQ